MNKIKSRLCIRIALILLSVGLVASLMGKRTRTTYTCLYCRALKTDKTYWGIQTSTIKQNKCSTWYNENHSKHEHSWKWSGSRSGNRFIYGYLASGPRHPVWDIQPTLQMLFLKQASPQEKEIYFNLLESGEGDGSNEAYAMASEAFDKLIYDHPPQQEKN